MPKDLSITAGDRPGEATRVAEALAEGGINVEGGYSSNFEGAIHVLVEDAEAARQALMNAHLQVHEEREVLVVSVDDRPGAAAEVFRKLSEGEISVEFYYFASNNRLALGVHDVERAQAALQ